MPPPAVIRGLVPTGYSADEDDLEYDRQYEIRERDSPDLELEGWVRSYGANRLEVREAESRKETERKRERFERWLAGN